MEGRVIVEVGAPSNSSGLLEGVVGHLVRCRNAGRDHAVLEDGAACLGVELGGGYASLLEHPHQLLGCLSRGLIGGSVCQSDVGNASEGIDDVGNEVVDVNRQGIVSGGGRRDAVRADVLEFVDARNFVLGQDLLDFGIRQSILRLVWSEYQHLFGHVEAGNARLNAGDEGEQVVPGHQWVEDEVPVAVRSQQSRMHVEVQIRRSRWCS